MNNTKKIYTTLPNGTKIEYQVILTTINPLTNKHYIVYTDNTLDKYNRIRLYVGIYDPNLQIPYIGEPTTKEEWIYITNILNKVLPQK